MNAIRPFEFSDRDYEVMVTLHNRSWPDYPNTVNEVRERDEARADKIRWARYVLEQNGEAIGMALYSQSLYMYHPRKFWVDVLVVPEQRRRGLGSQLWQHLLDQLRQYAPIALFAHTREDSAGGVAFAEKTGFTEAMREWESRLDPASVNLEEWRQYEERAAENAIEFKTVAQLRSDPEWAQKLYRLEMAIEQDVPNADRPTKVPIDEWIKAFDRSSCLPDAWFVAVHGDRYVGTSNLWRSEALPDVLYTGLTGVLREYRKQGIASGLKVQAIRYAQQQRIKEVRTWNEQNNRGMLGINNRLGFVRQPAHIEFVKHLRLEEEEAGSERKRESGVGDRSGDSTTPAVTAPPPAKPSVEAR